MKTTFKTLAFVLFISLMLFLFPLSLGAVEEASIQTKEIQIIDDPYELGGYYDENNTDEYKIISVSIEDVKKRLLKGEPIYFAKEQEDEQRTIKAVWIINALKKGYGVEKIDIRNAIITGDLNFCIKENLVHIEESDIKADEIQNQKIRGVERVFLVSSSININDCQLKDNLISGQIPIRKFIVIFEKFVVLRDIRVLKKTSFSHAFFNSKVDFSRINFNDDADFGGASFNDDTDFSNSSFNDDADFSHASFKDGVDFFNTSYNGEALFCNTSFNGEAFFRNTSFNEKACFGKSIFNGKAVFGEICFKMKADFSFANLNGSTNFKFAHFNGEANFRNASFKEKVCFSEASFNETVYFCDACFNGTACFMKTIFNGNVYFWDTIFNDEAVFNQARFDDKEDFGGAIFNGGADFSKVGLGEDNLSGID